MRQINKRNATLQRSDRPHQITSHRCLLSVYILSFVLFFLGFFLCSLKQLVDKLSVHICTIQIIMAKAAGGPKAPKQRGHWDKDGWDEEPDNFETHH